MMLEEAELINKCEQSLWDDFQLEKNYPEVRPLLAHYTTASAFESIVKNDEVWFSNPLNMNDYGEMTSVVFKSMQAVRSSREIKIACASAEKYVIFIDAIEREFDLFIKCHAAGIFAFCMTEHEPLLDDGLLSMWRGYGENGNGIAMVIDSSKFGYVEDSPIVFSKVLYFTEEEQLEWINSKLNKCAMILSNDEVSNKNLNLVAEMLFDRIKIHALTTKHYGFSEEREWRAIYIKDRDRRNLFSEMIDYAIHRRGPELKFKYKLRTRTLSDQKNLEYLSLEDLVQKVILGPSVSGAFARQAVEHMLQKIGKHNLCTKLVASSIPYRSY